MEQTIAPTIPTQAEIFDRLELRRPDDFFGFEWHEYVVYLSPEDFRKLLEPDATMTDEEVGEALKDLSREQILCKMEEYMPFAWEKANDFRGISAARSIAHYVAWTWLAGDRELSSKLEQGYEFYGKPQLVMICEFYGWDHTQWDDGIRRNSEPS